MKRFRCLALLAAGLWVSTLLAQTPTPPMPPASPELEARLKLLETELRCMVCQNQTLAESPAGLAGDLRREIRLLADAGKSNDEIKQHLRERYGDYVLYRPVVDSKTYLLWFGPFGLLAGGAILVWMMGRKRAAGAASAGAPALDAAESARAAAILGEAQMNREAIFGSNSGTKTGRLLHDQGEIHRLLQSAQVIAVVGLSGKKHRPSHGVAAYLQRHGYRIIPVNPQETEVLGEKCYPSLLAIPAELAAKIDIVDCFRKAGDIPPVVEDAITIDAKCVWMQLGIVNEAAAARAAAAGLDVVMNHCTEIEHVAYSR